MSTTTRQSSKSARLEQAPQNRSLERGVEILRAFRPGASLLGNGELAERTGLSRATVSRLTQTLVGTGLLDYDHARRAYRLAAPVLSLAHAMRSGSPVLQLVSPMLRSVAEKKKINVGLAVADREEMVYLESIRYSRKPTLRNVVAGQRVPIELTSLGRAFLAATTDQCRAELLSQIKNRRAQGWDGLEREILSAIQSVHEHGYCIASWQPEVVALATPVVVADHPIYVLNLSLSTQVSPAAMGAELSPYLMELAATVKQAIAGI